MPSAMWRSHTTTLPVGGWQSSIGKTPSIRNISPAPPAAGRPDQWDSVPGFWTTIGDATMKYHAWGDGFDRAHFVEHPGGGFTVWY